jgi:hypothetical protein
MIYWRTGERTGLIPAINESFATCGSSGLLYYRGTNRTSGRQTRASISLTSSPRVPRLKNKILLSGVATREGRRSTVRLLVMELKLLNRRRLSEKMCLIKRTTFFIFYLLKKNTLYTTPCALRYTISNWNLAAGDSGKFSIALLRLMFRVCPPTSRVVKHVMIVMVSGPKNSFSSPLKLIGNEFLESAYITWAGTKNKT